MKILLISPTWGNLYGKYSSVAKVVVFYPPLGLCYIGAALKKNNHEVKLIDAEAEGYNIESILKEIKKYNPDIIGIQGVSPLMDQVTSIAKEIKERIKTPIVLGGPHITILRNEVFKEYNCFDYGMIGESEILFPEFINVLEKNYDFNSIPGVLYRKNSDIIFTGERPIYPNINEYPVPDRSILNYDKYLWSIPKKGIVNLMTILTTRGCPFKCIFCSQDKMFSRKIRFREPKLVVDEIEDIAKNTPAAHIIFVDDTMTLKKSHVETICNGIIERGLDITLEGWTRANTITEELLILMKKAGLVRISFGIESGVPEVLKTIKKDVSIEEMKKAYKIAKKLGIETRGSVMIGHPTDTRKTVKQTFKFLRKLKDLDHPYINIAMPYPGTKLREMAEKGEGGLRLIDKSYIALRRYDSAVMEVNDLSRDDLIKLQQRGLLYNYLTPRRIWYNLRRAGLKAAYKNGLAFVKSMFFTKHKFKSND